MHSISTPFATRASSAGLAFTLLLMFDGCNSNQKAAVTLWMYGARKMEPDRLGRKLGVGVRVAGGMLRDRAAQTAHSMQEQAPVYAERGRVVKREGKKFGQSIWGPFAHASGVLWLEVTGLFFGLFGLFFAQNAYKLRQSWQTGPNHPRFLLYVAITALFAYFTVSSFLSARGKQKRRSRQPR
jgi:hypothetical protein